MSRVSLFAVAAIALALFWWSGARAQAPGGYDCDIEVYAGGAFDAHCDPQVTATTAPTETATGQPLAPWPMEGRALAELGVSVESIIQEYAGK